MEEYIWGSFSELLVVPLWMSWGVKRLIISVICHQDFVLLLVILVLTEWLDLCSLLVVESAGDVETS